ncbi:MAG: hypothetical protein FWE20_02500 [Defluviitaleaceae bacterium]|nr:hypothetical protein [Defluviitaleaceae bacterium]
MQSNISKLNILLDLIVKKKGLLTQILTICENQEAILSAERNEEYDKLFIGMGAEKQVLVDEVVATDALFQKMFDEIGSDFNLVGNENKNVIRGLQDQIMTVTELDTKIRLTENRNLERIASVRAKQPQRSVNEVSKQQLLKQYKSHDKKRNKKS